MPYMRKITVAAVNVTMHPHSPGLYQSLFERLHASAHIAKIRGDDWGMIGSLAPNGQGDDLALVGSLLRFLNIDPADPWLDLSTKRELKVDEDAEPVVPAHLKPNLRKAHYVFFPKGHRLFVDAREISPTLAANLMRNLSKHEEIARQFKEVNATVECDSEALEKILAAYRRQTIDIFIRRPNPDDLSDQKKRVLDRFAAQGAASLDESWAATRGGDLKPDTDTKLLMELALSNGRVKAVSYDQEGLREVTSTEHHPILEDHKYDPDEQSHLEVLHSVARELVSRLRRKG